VSSARTDFGILFWFLTACLFVRYQELALRNGAIFANSPRRSDVSLEEEIMRKQPAGIAMAFVTAWAVFAAPAAWATTIPIGVAAFGSGSTLTTFTGQVSGTEVNGLIVDGILFQYSLGNGIVALDGGPGVTNNISPLNIVSGGNDTGVLSMTLPSLVDSFGYGFAILSANTVAVATTMSLFDGATLVGSLSFGGAPDPTFTGGFAGVQSTLLFNRVDVTFNSAAAPAFALDNIRTANAVPEPGTLFLLTTGIGALVRGRRRGR
jgi:hypothetical protein